MKIHAFNEYSHVNGPGVRSVIHFQGCKFNCPGCFNPETHSVNAGMELSVQDIIGMLPKDIDGVTISGGEPFLQQEDLLQLVQAMRELGYSIIIFTGYYLNEIVKLKYGKEVLKYVDAIIDGRFDQASVSSSGLHGSDNQSVHLLTDRYAQNDFESRDVELIFDFSGNIRVTGFPTSDFLQKVEN